MNQDFKTNLKHFFCKLKGYLKIVDKLLMKVYKLLKYRIVFTKSQLNYFLLIKSLYEQINIMSDLLFINFYNKKDRKDFTSRPSRTINKKQYQTFNKKIRQFATSLKNIHNFMSQLSKFINLVIEYGQKLQSTLNKKYKPFIRSICNLEQLAKSVDPQNICLTRQMIIFKLGLQAKSTKSIEVSLFYLHKFFACKFIDLNVPNYCEQFQIQQTTVRKKENVNPKSDFRSQIVKMLQPLIHFKSNDINMLLLRVYEYLITEPIAPILLQLNLMSPNTQAGQKILFNYYSYRFYIFQEIYTFTEAQFRSINPLSIRNQRINKQIQAAFVNHQNLLDLVHKYVGEIVAAVAGIGGKYGLCVICKQPADYFCKITRASLCGADCKKRHLQIAEKQYRGYYQAVNLWKQIQPNFQMLLQILSKKQSRSLLSVLVGLLQKAHLFMIVKKQFRTMIGRHVAGIINMALNYKDQLAFEVIYSFISVLCRYWMVESMSSIEYFFKQSLLKILEDKKPNFKLLIIVFKSLAKIFQYGTFLCYQGKTSIELYVNFDCEYNKTNVVERVLFELSKICQDKFGSNLYYTKNQKIAIKNGAVTLISILVKGLNDYRMMYPEKVIIEQEILEIKQRKINLEKFIHKFNEHWSEGLKMLFNLNMVGLQSQMQIVDILLTIKGLKKEKIEQMLLSTNGRQYIQILFQNIIKAGPFMGLVELFRVVPLKKSSVLLKHYSDFVLTKMIKSKQDQNDQKQQYSVTKWVGFLTTNYTLKQLQKWLYMESIKINGSIDHVYMKCLETKGEATLGTHRIFFRHCISESYLEVFGSQLSLLQIPILFLLESSYSHEKIFEVLSDLIQICPHANWITLCLKNVDMERIKNGKYSSEDHSLIIGCLKMCKQHAQFIQDWSSILNFISKLYKVMFTLGENHKRLSVNTTSVLLEQPIKIREELTILQLEEYLLMIGQNSRSNFGGFVIGLIKLGEQEMQKQSIYFLQKSFQIMQHNISKFIEHFQIIHKELLEFIMKESINSIIQPEQQKFLKKQITILKNSKPHHQISSQMLIYVSDMLKQLFIKVLKQIGDNTKLNEQQKQSHINYQSDILKMMQIRFFKLFGQILKCENKQGSDFVMNSISMIIMFYYNLHPETWSYIVLEILKQHSKSFRQQTLTIIQKIIKQKLLHCEHLQFEILNLTLDLVDQKEVKLSIQSIHLLKEFVQLMAKESKQEQLQFKTKEEKHKSYQRKNIKKKVQISQIKQKTVQSVKSHIEKKKSIESEKVEEQVKLQMVKQQNISDQKNPKQTINQDKNDLQQKQNLEKPQLPQQKPATETKQQQIVQQSQNDSQSSDSSSSSLLTSSPKKLKQYLIFIISNLIQFISYECHEGAIDILFILLKTKSPFLNEQSSYKEINQQKIILNENLDDKIQGLSGKTVSQLLFESQQIDLIIGKIFKKLQSLPKQLHIRGQKIMNQSLFWAVRNKKYGIVKNLEECIINKYSSMSYTAMKCIKTFISMTNPKKPEDWNPIEQTLVKILKNTHLQDLLIKANLIQKRVSVQSLIQKGKILQESQKTNISLTQLSNKLIIQRMTVEVLPNDVKIIDQLLKIYHQTVQFNDDLYLRCLLWRQGLGSNNSQSPPDILSLEELISYRIISTYYWSKQYEKIADFTLQIINRYCQASRSWERLQILQDMMQSDAPNKTYELYSLCRNYWQKRRQPLKVIINYMLPKLPKICKDYSQKQKLLNGIIEGMKFCEERAPYVETIRQMTLVR